MHVEAASLCQPGPDLGVLLRAVHGLDLSLPVDAEHHRLVGRIQVQADDVAHRFNKEGID